MEIQVIRPASLWIAEVISLNLIGGSIWFFLCWAVRNKHLPLVLRMKRWSDVDLIVFLREFFATSQPIDDKLVLSNHWSQFLLQLYPLDSSQKFTRPAFWHAQTSDVWSSQICKSQTWIWSFTSQYKAQKRRQSLSQRLVDLWNISHCLGV